MSLGIGILITFVAVSLIISATQVNKPREPTTPAAVAVATILWLLVILAVIFL